MGLRFVALLSLALLACSDDGGTGGPCTPLEGDILNANPVYSADGEPMVIMRLDLAGMCAGTGEELYIVWRSDMPEVVTEPVPVHPMDLPSSEPGVAQYVYPTHGLTIDIQREGAVDVTLAFIDGSALPPGLRCHKVDGFLTCEEL